MNDLTPDEVNLLIEALEAWESSPTRDGMMSDLMGAVLVGGHPEAKVQYDAQRQKSEKERVLEKQRRKERVIMLSAKLLQMRDRGDVESLTKEPPR